MSLLREIRLSRVQLAGIAAVSCVATASVIADALGHSAAQTAALEALRHRPILVQAHPSQPRAAQPASIAGPSPIYPAPSIAPPSGSSVSAPSNGSGAPVSGPSQVSTTQTTSTTNTPLQRKVKHVFVIALSTTSFNAAFGPQSVARYLNRSLRRRGTLLRGYRTLGSSELPDYLAMVSGQAPNPDTVGECATYAEFPTAVAPDAGGLVPGAGCVYPNTALTVGDQVTATGHVWRAYIQDMGTSTCVHPNSDALDNAPLPGAGASYMTRHNPFIYFHSLLDLGSCATDDVSLTRLATSLRAVSRTPTYSFIAPSACLDAAASNCPTGGGVGLAGEDTFLRHWVPRILASPAYRRDGVLIIVFAHCDPGNQGGPQGDGPIRTGALVLSRYASGGRTVLTTYNPYSVLRSVEDLLGYKPLARAKSVASFIPNVLGRVG